MYRKKSKSWLKHWDFILIDMACIEIAFFGAYLIRHGGVMVNQEMYMRLGILLVLFELLSMFINKSYTGIIQRMKWGELKAVIQHITVVEVLLLVYEYVMKEANDLSRIVFLVSWGVSIVLCWCGRLIWKKIIRIHMSNNEGKSNLLLISNSDKAEVSVRKLYKKLYRDFQISAIVFLDEKDNMSGSKLDAKMIYGYQALVDYIKQGVVDEVYIDAYDNKQELEKLVRLFLEVGVTVHIGIEILPNNLPNRFMEKIGDCNCVTTSIKTASGMELTIKRMMDIAGGLVGLLITGVAYIIVAPIIKMQSPGPALFKQQRVGKNGRVFCIYKFRSMYMDAEERKKALMEKNEMTGHMFKMKDDPRIIGSEKGPGKGIGNFIRKTSIDELPQFWNVLKGDMSLVGTRPPTINEYEQYDLHHMRRLSAKPGLTGMWQTSGRSEITDFEEVVKLDVEYIENWSLLLDVKLILKTIKVVLFKIGAK